MAYGVICFQEFNHLQLKLDYTSPNLLSSMLAIGSDGGLSHMVGDCVESRRLLFQVLELELRWKCNKRLE